MYEPAPAGELYKAGWVGFAGWIQTITRIHFRFTLNELVRWFRARGATPTNVALIHICTNPHLRINEPQT